MNRWSTLVPVELSNRELHREGWEHDGICLKVAVAGSLNSWHVHGELGEHVTDVPAEELPGAKRR